MDLHFGCPYVVQIIFLKYHAGVDMYHPFRIPDTFLLNCNLQCYFTSSMTSKFKFDSEVCSGRANSSELLCI